MDRPKTIKSATGRPESETAVANGILKSAYLTTFQRSAMAGIVKSAMPEKMGPEVKLLQKVKPGKTKEDIGVVHYPGSKYGGYPKRK
jgi:hypothetical protein